MLIILAIAVAGILLCALVRMTVRRPKPPAVLDEATAEERCRPLSSTVSVLRKDDEAPGRKD